MTYRIQKAAVLGSGVMGSGIAAHLANIGIPTVLLDIVPKDVLPQEEAKGYTLEHPAVRNRFAQTAVEKLKKHKPAPLASKESLARIRVGNLEDDLQLLRDVDWIIEVVVENLSVKQALFEKIETVRKPGTIITSNTSGISVHAMIEGRSEDFQKHFLGTHFFNPPRYLKLLEVIPTNKTAADVLAFMQTFGEDVLGKGVVVAKDTPNFIANRIGTYGLLVTLQQIEQYGYSVGEVDSVTGPLIGRPSSATFRTLDVVGLDTFVHVARNVYDNTTGEEQAVFADSPLLLKMVENNMLGAKSGAGFFKKEGKEILELDVETFSYVPKKKLTASSIEMAKQLKGAQKLQTLVYADDRSGKLLWDVLSKTSVYAAQLHREIADDIVAIDNAMKWGFGWSQGPFELWDAIGVEKSVAKLQAEGVAIPAFAQTLLDKGYTSFYSEVDGKLSYFNGEQYVAVPTNDKAIHLKALKQQQGVLKSNSGASLIDIGDDVALLEFHTKSNAIGLDIIAMINESIDLVEQSDYKGLVIGNQGKNFCVGANLGMMLMEAQDDNIFELDYVIRSFQKAMRRIKYSTKPVVAAPFNMTLGGGTEVCLPAAHIQAAHETYMGLVEVGVGLIPGGGGTIALYEKMLRGVPNGVRVDIQEIANKVFETVAMAKTSTSAAEARELNLLNFADGISVNPDHLIYDAKQAVIALAEAGYTAPVRKQIPVVGATGYGTLLIGAQGLLDSGFISEHDFFIAKKLAFVLAGGMLPYGTEVDEDYLFNLEREAFLQLIAHPLSQQRMQHMLVKGKPLRN